MRGRPLPVLQRGSLWLQRDPTEVCRAEPRAWGHRGPGWHAGRRGRAVLTPSPGLSGGVKSHPNLGVNLGGQFAPRADCPRELAVFPVSPLPHAFPRLGGPVPWACRRWDKRRSPAGQATQPGHQRRAHPEPWPPTSSEQGSPQADLRSHGWAGSGHEGPPRGLVWVPHSCPPRVLRVCVWSGEAVGGDSLQPRLAQQRAAGARALGAGAAGVAGGHSGTGTTSITQSTRACPPRVEEGRACPPPHLLPGGKPTGPHTPARSPCRVFVHQDALLIRELKQAAPNAPCGLRRACSTGSVPPCPCGAPLATGGRAELWGDWPPTPSLLLWASVPSSDRGGELSL